MLLSSLALLVLSGQALALQHCNISGRSGYKSDGVCTRRGECGLQERRAGPSLCPPDQVCCPLHNRFRRDVQRISQKKCAEYAKLVFTYEDDPTGFTDDKHEINNCVSTGTPLVVGGVEAESREFPFMALIGYGSGSVVHWKCGGTLISPRFVLSAAHCSSHRELGLARWVLLGDLNVSSTTDDAKPQYIKIKDRINHADYNKFDHYNDITLFRLENAAVMDLYVRPACVLEHVQPKEDDKAWILGWGATENGTESSHLQKAVIKVTSETACTTKYPKYSELPEGILWNKMMCAGSKDKIDTCQGDSGGPLAVESGEFCTLTIVGVTSFGAGCATNLPGVYTRVSHYISWIERIVWPGE